jgi:hypothetical protein
MFYGRAINIYNEGTSNWYNGSGAPICLNFGEDILLLSEDYPGKQCTWNFQVQCTFTNAIWEFNQSGQNQQSTFCTLQIDIIVVSHGAMTVSGQSVTLHTGLVPPGASIPQLAKVSFPHETDMYSGGKFDLGSILSSIPGRIMRGISGLVSGLLGSEEPGESPVKSAIRRGVRALPSIARQIRELHEAEK